MIREFAQRLADNQMVALFHGCPVPTGINRTYPNILNFEAVRGAECNFWESTLTPEYAISFYTFIGWSRRLYSGVYEKCNSGGVQTH